MVNLFRLLGLPNPNNTPKATQGSGLRATEPGPKAGNRFDDLGEARWSERTKRITDRPFRKVIYMEPDGLHRIQLEGVEGNLSSGDMVIVDLSSLNHMPSQQSVCSRKTQELGDRTNLHVFALNEDDTLLMIPGAKMRVDTHKHMLGSPSLERAIEN